MPRKVRRKAKGARPPPKKPEGDEGKYLSDEEKKSKLEVMLNDFDKEVANRIAILERETKKMVEGVMCVYRMELLRIPKFWRDMKMSDFLKAGGSLGEMAIKEGDQRIKDNQKFTSLDAKVEEVKLKETVKKYQSNKRKKVTILQNDTISEEENGPQTVRKYTRNTARKQLAPSTAENLPPPTATRTSRRTAARTRNQFETPRWKAGASAAGWETPLITPKFDPRLPITPARTMKPGELVMSLAGSPLLNVEAENKADKLVNMLVNKTGIENLDSISVPDLDQNALTTLQMVQQKLHAILQLPSDQS